MTEPLVEIIDRQIPVTDVQTHYRDQLKLLRDLVNYGSNLIVRCFRSSDRGVADVVLLTALAKQAIAMLDTVEVCLSNAAVLGSHPALRVLFECRLYVDWMLEADTETRARRYYVGEVRRRRLMARRIISGTPENTSYDHVLRELTLPMADLEDDAKKELLDIDKLLASTNYASINSEFDAFVTSKRSWDPHWYELPKLSDSPKSIRDLSKKLGRLHDYDVAYANLSGVVHSTCFRSHVKIGNGFATFEPIRHLEHIVFTIQLGAGSILGIFRALTEHYRPAEIPNLEYKYKSDWRSAFLKIPRPNYSTNLTIERQV